MTRDISINVNQILDKFHQAQVCIRSDKPPFYPANEVGRSLNALPTLVSFPGSYAFRNGGPGMVLNTITGQLEEPNADERERAMGFPTGATAAPHINERQRRRLLGQAIDLRCLIFILAIGLAHSQAISTPTLSSDLDRGGETLIFTLIFSIRKVQSLMLNLQRLDCTLKDKALLQLI